jgi:amidase
MDAADLAFAGAARQAELIRSREVAARELTELYLERIGRLDPQLNAFRVVFAERALAEADQAAGRSEAGDGRPLLGVPIAVKDDQAVAGAVRVRGSNACSSPEPEDADLVRRLRAAGGIVVGITRTPELTLWPFTETAAGGITRNPWNPQRTPGGSSGGSGAAVAAGLAPGALGSDGGGSIRYPAAFCGLFGLKPQRGRISLAPLPEHWHGLTAYGWLTRRVIDSALLLDVTAGAAPGDVDSPPPPPRPFAEAVRTPPGKLRVAMSLKPPPAAATSVDDEVRAGVEEAAQLLRSLGHEVRERDPEYGLMLSWLVRYLRGIHDEGVTLPRPQRLERRTRSMIRAGGLISPEVLERARAAEPQVAARVNSLFAEHDVLLTPMTTRPAPEVGTWEGRGALLTFNGIGRVFSLAAAWNTTGQPAAVVPIGIGARGLPRSVQLVGRPNDEGTLLSLAAQIEAEHPWADRRPPVS